MNDCTAPTPFKIFATSKSLLENGYGSSMNENKRYFKRTYLKRAFNIVTLQLHFQFPVSCFVPIHFGDDNMQKIAAAVLKMI